MSVASRGWGVGIVAVCGALALVDTAAFIAIRATGESDGPGSQVIFPTAWNPAQGYSSGESAPEGSSITLNEDHTATLSRVDVGEIAEIDGESCMSIGYSEFSGDARWDLDPDDSLFIRTAGGDAVIAPSRARFDGYDWSSSAQPFCDGSPHWYVLQTSRR